jgi:hypothetical protein
MYTRTRTHKHSVRQHTYMHAGTCSHHALAVCLSACLSGTHRAHVCKRACMHVRAHKDACMHVRAHTNTIQSRTRAIELQALCIAYRSAYTNVHKMHIHVVYMSCKGAYRLVLDMQKMPCIYAYIYICTYMTKMPSIHSSLWDSCTITYAPITFTRISPSDSYSPRFS